MPYTYDTEEEFKPRKNKRVYHYTSPAGLKAILENRTLRFTDCQFLNDKSEYTYFGSVLEETLDGLQKQVSLRTMEIVQELYDGSYDAEGRLIGLRKEGSKRGYRFAYIPSRYYVFCTSLGSDSLNMWNYYVKSGNYQGYNLGLDIEMLFRELQAYSNRSIKIYRGKVVYQKSSQIAVLTKFIRDMDEKLAELDEESDEEDEETVEGWLDCIKEEMLEQIQYCRLLFKQTSFSSEKEYRYILKAPRDLEREDIDGIEAGFCEKHGVLAPYCDIHLSMKALKSIRIAPMVEPEIAEEGLRRFLHKNQYPDTCTILKSEVPIRY